MRLVDTHCHINNEKFNDDIEIVIERIKEKLEFCVNIGYDLKSSEESLELSQKYEFIYATIGVHPTDIGMYSDDLEKKLKEMAKNRKVVAIGEIGLDYYWMTEEKEKQKSIFRRQMEIAKDLNLPVVIHSRDAMEDTLEILKEYPEVGGIVHCYPGSIESAKEIMDRYYFGIGGTLTFKNAKKMVKVVEELPLEKIVIETDSPYLTPEPFRGKRNEPVYVEYVAKKIAEIKNVDFEKVVEITTNNAKKIYRIGEK